MLFWIFKLQTDISCLYCFSSLQAYVLQEQGKLLDLVDPILGSNYSKEEALRMLNMALLCTNQSFSLRPSMSTIVSMTEGKTKVEAPMRTETEDDMRFKAFEKGAHDSQSHSYTFSQESRERGISVDGPWADSSVSFQTKDASTSKLLPDLYDVNIDWFFCILSGNSSSSVPTPTIKLPSHQYHVNSLLNFQV